jgi:4'-phosphopantetheinyl transferase
MIYRIYFDPGEIKDEPDAEHRYSEFLLAYALFREKQLIYTDQNIMCNAWGKPFLRNYPHIHYNASHCRGLASCVLADVPVGIDVENIRTFSSYVLRRAYSEEEREDIRRAEDPDRQFFIYWTLKESCVKAMGTGIAYPLRQVVFRISEHEIQCTTHPEYRFLLLEDSKRCMTAVCYRNTGKSVRYSEDMSSGRRASIWENIR